MIVTVLAVAAVAYLVVRHGSCGDLEDVVDDLTEEELDNAEYGAF